jgi:hypothetical protein
MISRLSITTNATNVRLYNDQELTNVLSHFDDLCISVYGLDAEEFSEMTGTDEYELMRTGVDRILRFSRARTLLAFRCLKNRSNDEIRVWAEALESFARAATHIRLGENTNHFANWGIFDTTKSLPFDAQWIKPVIGEKPQCGIPLLALQVFSDGNVSFCPCDDFDNDESLHLGNVMNATLSEMLASPKAQRLRNWAQHGTPTFCQSCSFHRSVEAIVSIPGIVENPLLAVGG